MTLVFQGSTLLSILNLLLAGDVWLRPGLQLLFIHKSVNIKIKEVKATLSTTPEETRKFLFSS